MGTFLIILAIVIVVGFGALLTVAIKQDNKKRAAREQGLSVLKVEYGADEAYVSLFDLGLLGIRWSDEKVFFGTAPAQITSYSFSEILSSDIEVEGGRITRTKGQLKTRRGSQVLGAAAGGLALGPTGLLIGGLSGGSKTTSTAQEADCVSRITLAVQVRDKLTPIQRVLFWEWPAPGAPRDHVRDTLEQASRFQALLKQASRTAAEAR